MGFDHGIGPDNGIVADADLGADHCARADNDVFAKMGGRVDIAFGVDVFFLVKTFDFLVKKTADGGDSQLNMGSGEEAGMRLLGNFKTFVSDHNGGVLLES